MNKVICSVFNHNDQKCTYCREFFRCGILKGQTCLWVKSEQDEKAATEGFNRMMEIGRMIRNENGV